MIIDKALVEDKKCAGLYPGKILIKAAFSAF